MNLKAVIEGLLFVVGDDGLDLDEISKILEISKDETKELIKELQNDYQSSDRGIRIDFLGDKLKLTTKKEHNMYYQKLLTTEDNNTLSQAALETLAIIAYNQPITRVKVDECARAAKKFNFSIDYKKGCSLITDVNALELFKSYF